MSTLSRALLSVAAAAAVSPSQAATDGRIREVVHDEHVVVTVPVKRGTVTHVRLDGDEGITDVAAGLGGDCSKPDAAWCIAAQAGTRHLFVKAKSSAAAANNVAVVTNRRVHAFRFVVLADDSATQPVYRLDLKPPPRALEQPASIASLPPLPLLPSPVEIVAERLKAPAAVVNADYSLAEGRGSHEIVPDLVFDDGRFTYLRLPGQRPVPAVFQVLADGSEAIVNTHMEDELLVVDRVCQELLLRAGSAVVSIRNESFDATGRPPVNATTVIGVRRALKAEPRAQGESR